MPKSIRIGLLIAEQGPAGIWSASARACGELAVHEHNRLCGILGRPVELLVLDTGTTARSAADAASQALDIDEVDAIIGMFPSFARKAVIDTVGGTVPFLYTPQFEGFECERGVMTTGETASELLEPAIEWLIRSQGRSRFFLGGSDYLWPRASFAAARRLIGRYGGEVVGERYLPLDTEDFEDLSIDIERTRADVVLPHFLGLDAIRFHRSFGSLELARRVLRFASAVDETVIYGLAETDTENLFVASAYFASLRSRNNGSFLERYHERFGDRAPPLNAYGQSCYEGIYALASLAEAAGCLDVEAIRRSTKGTRQRRSARGDDTGPLVGARHPIHFARVEGYDLTILPSL